MAWSWTSQLPFQLVWFTERAALREVRDLVDKTQPDVLYCQLIRCAEYVKDLHHVPKVLDYMDALSAGMHRRAHSRPGSGFERCGGCSDRRAHDWRAMNPESSIISTPPPSFLETTGCSSPTVTATALNSCPTGWIWPRSLHPKNGRPTIR